MERKTAPSVRCGTSSLCDTAEAGVPHLLSALSHCSCGPWFSLLSLSLTPSAVNISFHMPWQVHQPMQRLGWHLSDLLKGLSG